MVDNPTACSRRKIARSPIRSRIVSAVPMKMAPTFISTKTCPGWLGASLRGLGGPRPVTPGTDSESTPLMNGSSARKTK